MQKNTLMEEWHSLHEKINLFCDGNRDEAFLKEFYAEAEQFMDTCIRWEEEFEKVKKEKEMRATSVRKIEDGILFAVNEAERRRAELGKSA